MTTKACMVTVTHETRQAKKQTPTFACSEDIFLFIISCPLFREINKLAALFLFFPF